MNTQNKIKTILTLAIMAMAVFAGSVTAALPEPSGINPQTGVAWANGDQYRLVFITSSNPEGATDPNILNYNARVQTLANNAGLGEAAWYVIGSTDEVDARDNTSTNPEDPNDPNCPIYLVDAITLVAIDNPDLWDGVVEHIIDQSETGGAPSPHGWAFTGTYKDGIAVVKGVNSGGGPLGSTGEVSQCKAGAVDGWIWYQMWLSDPGATPNCLYAMSEALTVGGIDPTDPVVNAGSDMITWSDEPVDMDPTVVNNLEPTPLEYVWTIEALDVDEVVALTPNSGNPLTSTDPAPTATVTKTNAGGKVTAKVTLTVNNQGDTNYVSDFMLIDVYDNACAAANAVAPVTYDEGDINQDCNVDLKDIAEIAEAWLNSYELSGPVAK